MPRPPKFTGDEARRIAYGYANGATLEALAEKWGCTRQTITNTIKRHGGIAIRPAHRITGVSPLRRGECRRGDSEVAPPPMQDNGGTPKTPAPDTVSPDVEDPGVEPERTHDGYLMLGVDCVPVLWKRLRREHVVDQIPVEVLAEREGMDIGEVVRALGDHIDPAYQPQSEDADPDPPPPPPGPPKLPKKPKKWNPDWPLPDAED